jgi:protein-L-isoaspartate(D-aspartate) O-methyltransferase
MCAQGDMETAEVYAVSRIRMVEEQLARRGIVNSDVLSAMRTVPRHLFMPESERDQAYTDGPLPIGFGQTISQPYVVASMTEVLSIDHTSKVLEVGTGSGYQTAVLAEIAREVFTIEIVPQLYERTIEILRRLGYQSVRTRLADGRLGWPEEAPYDAIMVTAAAEEIPRALIEQLACGGRLVIPVQKHDPDHQELILLHKTAEGVRQTTLYDVRFVPLVGGEE